MTGLTPGAVVSGLADGLAIAATGGNAAVAAARPASSNRLRRERIARAFSAGPHLFRSSFMLSHSPDTPAWPALTQRSSGTSDRSAPWNYGITKIRYLKTVLIFLHPHDDAVANPALQPSRSTAYPRVPSELPRLC